MANDVKLQEGHPVDENLRPLKVGGKTTAIETAQHGNGARVNGDLEVTGTISVNKGDLICDDLIISGDITKEGTLKIQGDSATDINLASGNATPRIRLVDNDNKIASSWESDGTSSQLILYEAGGSPSPDNMTINVTTNGASTISTNDGTDEEADLIIDVDGDITLDSHTGNFLAKKAGTEFSAANSSYAGMILGYTRIQNDGTTSGQAIISIDTSMTVLETVQGTQVKVTFVAPPSGNVEIQFQSVFTTQDTYFLSLSSAYSYAEIDEIHTYDYTCVKNDETDVSPHILSFAETGLTAGTEYTRWIAAKVATGTGSIAHGRNRTTGTHAPPIIVKAIALPATIVTGE